MHRITRRFALFLLLLPVLLGPGGPAFAETVDYVALGDSLATGYRSTGYPARPNPGYVYRLHQHLQSGTNNTVVLTNTAIDGLPSSGAAYQLLPPPVRALFPPAGLLEQLRYDPAVRAAVANAEILTVSVGGNNLLAPAVLLLGGQIDQATANGLAQHAVGVFRADWPAILSEIRSLNPKAALYVLNVYNPFEYLWYSPASTLARNYIPQINQTINTAAYQTGYKYKVADAARAFSGRTLAYTQILTLFSGNPSDPFTAINAVHPTDQGHSVLFNLHRNLLPSTDDDEDDD